MPPEKAVEDFIRKNRKKVHTFYRAYRGLSARFFAEHMAGRLVGDSRNWLNHASLRRSGFQVVVLGVGADAAPQPALPVRWDKAGIPRRRGGRERRLDCKS